MIKCYLCNDTGIHELLSPKKQGEKGYYPILGWKNAHDYCSCDAGEKAQAAIQGTIAGLVGEYVGKQDYKSMEF